MVRLKYKILPKKTGQKTLNKNIFLTIYRTMEEWNSRWKFLNMYIKDLQELYLYPEEWNEAYMNNYVKMPHGGENYCLIAEELAIKQEQLLNERDDILFKKQDRTLTEYMFITINPDPKYKISVKTMYDKCMKIFKSKNVSNYLMVLEQRGKNVGEVGNGLHTHFILQHKYRKYCELRKHLQRIFGDVIGNDKHIWISCCKTINDVDKRKKYMLGDKEGHDKQIKQQWDKVFRLEKGIDDYYGDENIGYLSIP